MFGGRLFSRIIRIGYSSCSYSHSIFSRRAFSSASARESNRVGPLTGIRILDLSRILAGPFCSQLLSDLGAEVIKVEEPHRGDDSRHWGPPFTSHGHISAYFASVNRNKKSIGIDLKSPKGKRVFRDLIKVSDVVLENFVPGKLGDMGCGYEQCKEENPLIIYISLSGYGDDGPLHHKPGYDVMAAAYGGLLGITGTAKEPSKVGVAITDLCTGLYAHGAIMAALLHRQRKAESQYISISLLETQVALLANIGQNYLTAGMEGRRLGTQHESIVPYQSFEASDGFFIGGALNDLQFKRMANALHIDMESGKFDTNPLRVANRDILIPILQKTFKEKPKAHWLRLLDSIDVPSAPINTISEVFADPQVQHRQMVTEVEHPTAGKMKLIAPPVKYHQWDSHVRLPPPILNEHSKEILKDLLGYDEHSIEELTQGGVVGTV